MHTSILWLTVLTLAQVGDRPNLVPGKFGKGIALKKAIEFDDNARYLEAPITVEAWAKLDGKKNLLVETGAWSLGTQEATGFLEATILGQRIASAENVCDGKWHHLSFTWETQSLSLYIDGVKARFAPSQPKAPAKKQPLKIGPFDGVLDELRVSSIVRPIAGQPKEELTFDIPTIGLWRFENEDALFVDPAWTPRPALGKTEVWERMTDKDWLDDRLKLMDTGPFLNHSFVHPAGDGMAFIPRGIAIKTGSGGILFDRNQLRLAAVWKGDFLTHSNRRFGLLNHPTPAGEVIFSTPSGLGWLNPDGDWKNPHPSSAPLPHDWAKWHGHTLQEDRVTFHYSVGDAQVLDRPWVHAFKTAHMVVRDLEVGPSKKAQQLCLVEGADLKVITNTAPNSLSVRLPKAPLDLDLQGAGAKLEFDSRRIVATFPPSDKKRRVAIHMVIGAFDKIDPNAGLDADLTQPGPRRWTKVIETTLDQAKNDSPYVIDTLNLPYENPYKALFFVAGVDFLPSKEVAICTAHGDVWLVKETSGKLAWTRFATGLYQPLGLKVLGGKIHVIERGQLTRLHDVNKDGEADFYESISGDWHVGRGQHSFDSCLETDPVGNFFFLKSGDFETPTGGSLIRISPDGKKTDIYATGFRHPVGMGMSPTGILSTADQEGNWMPATRIDWPVQGGFYGDMRAHHRTTPPKTYDGPFCWLPRDVDNSAGGQVWVPKGLFGPLSEKMLHLSYGRCRLLGTLAQVEGKQFQGGAFDLGLFFLSGILRARFNPYDQHLYLVGLNGWQTAARKDGCLQRVRYTGQPTTLPTELTVLQDGIRLGFNEPLETSAEELSRYRIEQWNYRWSGDYGSKRWSVKDPTQIGQDAVPIESAKLSDDRRSVFLKIRDVKPVMQMQIGFNLRSARSTPVVGSIYNTIHFVK